MARLVPSIFFVQLIFLLLCMEAQAGRLGPTPDDEVEALRKIGKEMGKKDWNFSVDPCSTDDPSWKTPKSALWPTYQNSVFCNCLKHADKSSRVCHVVQLCLEGQDLDGVPPPSIVKLPYLQKIDLSRNYLTGTIPSQWASLKLIYLSFNVNKLSGPIPSFLGNIATLKTLNIENNLFFGIIPPQLGDLVNLECLILSSNNLTGELPFSLTKLTRLDEFRISRNNFTGRIPDIFRSWKVIRKLEIEASGLEGPIPPSISVLSNLTELRISDLFGESSKFPLLSNMTGMKKLMLRSCNLFGTIPANISEMEALKTL
ncbi:hypothetical protein FH972_001092 [Carpinus fangiana]|uniref:Leucine-rich repeat-containing N-terminal plant-type domain-containing protein n=1 Tax=Carpinus fangiana TaxID=176857 RepID=A0A5N6QD21_9ROSI|nr:hypothetical protein FH972_001092 [Carpinus fangiana]